MKVLLVGLSHKTAPVEIREKLDFSPTALRSVLTHFDTNHRHAHLQDVLEGIVLSTCNRMEVYALVRDAEVAGHAIVDLLSKSCDTAPEIFADYLYRCEDEAAIEHLFRVAAGLDSMVLGEPQILGQITEAYEAALSQNSAGTVLSALFRAAIHSGKRVRTETRIGVNPASISSVAAGLAAELLGDLPQRHVVMIGAGEMGAVAVRALLKRGVSQITVANRTFANAEVLASEWGGKAISFQQLPATLISADIVISCTGAPHTILTRDIIAPAVEARHGQPLFILDIAVPRDVDPNVTELPNVHLQDIDDLQNQAKDNVRERQAEIPYVEAIVQEEMDQFLEWLASLDVVATITDLRRQLEQLRLKELDYLFNRVELDEREREMVIKMSHRLVNKILYQPTRHLKQEAVNGNGAAVVSTVRQLFSLDTKSMNNEQ